MNTPVEGTHLGKPTIWPSCYSPGLLVAVPRKENRIQYDIHDSSLPFLGMDIWHAWEIGFLTDTGLPVVGILKLTYPSDSESLVESKSLKLYLNSFNMEKLGPTADAATRTFVARVRNDLCTLLNTTVNAAFFKDTTRDRTGFHNYSILEDQPSCIDDPFEDHKENPTLLQTDSPDDHHRPLTLRVGTHLLRSNCKITLQPDWGSAFIHMSGHRLPTEKSLLKYIVSFRNENHFHEEVCEMIYKRLLDFCTPDALAVTCIYTRRGGIDICPTRVSDASLLPANLTTHHILTRKLPRQ